MARKQKYDYFKAFERQADLALQEADLLIDVIENFTTAEAVREVIPKAHEIEQRADEINHETYMAIAKSFITPIDRDDILAIAGALDDVIDDIEDIINLFYMMDVHFMHKDIIGVAHLLRKSCEALKLAMSEFPDFRKSAAFSQAIISVNDFEEQADELHEKLMHNLFTVDAENPMRVVVWSRIFLKLENCCDGCEHVADVLSTVLLKNV